MSGYAAALGLFSALGVQQHVSSDAGLAARAAGHSFLICLVLLAVCIIAKLTNPSDAAFRSFLTDLSFQSHLKRLRSAAAQATTPTSDAHVLNFSNRIAISLRTPPYVLRNYGLFSTVSMAPAGAKKGVASDYGEAGPKDSPFGHRAGFFVGAFGRWWVVDDGSSEDGRAEKDRLASSVMAMEAVDIKLPLSPKDVNAQKVSARQSPAHGRSRSTSSSDSALASAADKEHTPAPVVNAVPRVVAPLSPAVIELQQQLQDLQKSTGESGAKLQSELDKLKARKRDEDAVRAELKSKSKAAEEVKRQADHEHAEAAKRASTARASRQTALDRTNAADAELARLDRKAADLTARSTKSAKSRATKEGKLKQEVAEREEQLKQAEAKAKTLAGKVEDLESAIEQRKTAIYARLTHPAINRASAVPYPMVPASAMPWSGVSDHAANVFAPSSGSSPSLGPDFGLPSSIPTSSFLEHRMQHLSDVHAGPSAFGPFNSPLSVGTASGPKRGVPLPLFSPPSDISNQLLADGEARDGEGAGSELDGTPLSPMTPNHRGLIPSTLFDMLDGDDDDVLDREDMAGDPDFPWPAIGGTSVAAANRHTLALNPDAKAFSFNRPLPVRSESSGNLPTVAVAAPQPKKEQDWLHFSPFD